MRRLGVQVLSPAPAYAIFEPPTGGLFKGGMPPLITSGGYSGSEGTAS